MSGFDIWVGDSHRLLPDNPKNPIFCSGGLFLDTSTVPSSIINNFSDEVCCYNCPVYSSRKRAEFLCLSLSIKGKDGVISNSAESVAEGGSSESKEAVGDTFAAVVKPEKRVKVRLRGRGAVNTTKHLWSGAVAAMVSRSIPFVFCVLFFYFLKYSSWLTDASTRCAQSFHSLRIGRY